MEFWGRWQILEAATTFSKTFARSPSTSVKCGFYPRASAVASEPFLAEACACYLLLVPGFLGARVSLVLYVVADMKSTTYQCRGSKSSASLQSPPFPLGRLAIVPRIDQARVFRTRGKAAVGPLTTTPPLRASDSRISRGEVAPQPRKEHTKNNCLGYRLWYY